MSGDHQQQTQAKTPLVYIKEGYGGIVDFKGIEPQHTSSSASIAVKVKHVGTSGCWSCVGLYIPLDENHCFVAHIMAARKDKSSNFPLNPGVNEDEGIKLKDRTLDMIKKAVGEELSDNQAMRVAKEKAIIVCPRPRMTYPNSDDFIPNGPIFAGHYVVDAICDFLDLKASEKLNYKHGFVVDHYSDGHPEYLGRDTSEPNADEPEMLLPEQSGYERVNETGVGISQSWNIVFVDGKWEVIKPN